MEQNSKPPMSTVTSPRPAVKNILRSVESHVRLMSHLENTSTSSSYTSVRLRDSKSDNWTGPFNVTRVHRGTSTINFYQEVVAPCVENSLAGQSYLFLVSGPCESGRSQTLYGSPHHSTKGIIELAAEDLLRFIDGNAARDGDNCGRGQPTVTHSAFVTRGSHINETTTGEPVPIVNFPPPLGPTALPRMKLLESAAAVVQIPELKHMDTSCIVQLQVYVPVDSLGRRSMATLTFVDVAAFREQQCSEVRHLIATVSRVAGVASGDEPGFDQRKLTALLEPALMGYVTLVSITTISGRDDLYEAACAALRFAETISRIHQVLMLVHINTPKWFLETAEKLETLRLQRGKVLGDHHARGVCDYYFTVANWLAQHVGDVDGTFDKLLEEVEKIRKDLAVDVGEQTKTIMARLQEEQKQCATQLERTRAVHSEIALQLDKLKRMDETIATLTQQGTQRDVLNDQKISEICIEVASIENETNMHKQELIQLEKEEKLYGSKCGEVLAVLDKYVEDFTNSQMHFVLTTEMNAIAQKKRRLEADLAIASQMAHKETDNFRTDRERRAKLSRLAMMQQKVDTLRERVKAGSASNSKTSSPNFRSPRDIFGGSPPRSPALRRRRLTSPGHSAS
uniref:Kinesin motor domain-containing protein n=1 Tax=Trypanosoma congolense (strain IL3000) TaxID=1068625 RepID=G0UQE9_TRYCI|nr:conserved hypothetical protein [Trypanosoma congolense IL3000]